MRPGRVFAVTVEGVDGSEEEEGTADVGGDECAVCEEVGIEGEEGEGEEACGGAEHLRGCEVEEQGEGEHEECAGHACGKEDSVASVAEDECPAVEESFHGHGTALIGGDVEVHGKQGSGGGEFDERGDFGVQGIVVELPDGVAVEEVVRLVPCGGGGACDVDELKGDEAKEAADTEGSGCSVELTGKGRHFSSMPLCLVGWRGSR